MASGQKCAHVKEDGTACGAYTVENSAFCFFHSPHLKEERQNARRKGGKSRSLKLKEAEQKHLQTLDQPDPPTNLQEAYAYAAWVTDQVAKGFLEESRANVLLRAMKEFRQAREARLKEEKVYERLSELHASRVETGEIEPENAAWLRDVIRTLHRKLEKLEGRRD